MATTTEQRLLRVYKNLSRVWQTPNNLATYSIAVLLRYSKLYCPGCALWVVGYECEVPEIRAVEVLGGRSLFERQRRVYVAANRPVQAGSANADWRITGYVRHQQGYLTEEECRWVEDQLRRNGEVPSTPEVNRASLLAQRPCLSCGAVGFPASVTGHGCEFCDGTEGGNPPHSPNERHTPTCQCRVCQPGGRLCDCAECRRIAP